MDSTVKHAGGGANFLDFKLKRRRISEIIRSVSRDCQIESDVQSNTSCESGYASQTDGSPTNEKSVSPKTNGWEDSNENVVETNQNDVKESKDPTSESIAAHLNPGLFVPPPFCSNNVENMHIGVAYVSFPSESFEQSDKQDRDMKMGLIPVMSSMPGFVPLGVNGLSGISLPKNLPKGIQPVFVTAMPNGFIMTSSGPVALQSNTINQLKGQQEQQEAVRKHRLSCTDSERSSSSGVSSKKIVTKETESEFIEHYTNGTFEYLGHLGSLRREKQSDSAQATSASSTEPQNIPKEDMVQTPTPTYDNKYPMVCGICNDKATGLHYGIITCEG